VDAAGIYDPQGRVIANDTVYDWPNFGHEMGRTNYLGMGGAYGKVDPSDNVDPTFHYTKWWPYTGIYYMSSKTKIGDITDGTSNTIAFGEYVGVHNGNYSAEGYPGGSRDLVFTWMGGGWTDSKYGLAPVYDPTGNWRKPSTGTDYVYQQWSSNHTGIVNFAFADGSVRPIGKTADFNSWIYASGMQDGTVLNLSLLGQ
jgi:prepilin-type processing-associated H-X9-DG protein